MKLVEITHGMLEQYEEGLVTTEVEGLSVTHFNRLLIELAKDAGMAIDLPDDMLNCKPSEIQKWTLEITKHVLEAKAPVDPN